ncbi:hypothetical protein ES703_60601 [subsurface metagenome]
MARGIETHNGIVIIPDALTAEEIAEAIWEHASATTLLREIQHDSYIFPEDTNRFVTFTAGAGDNEWSDWEEIVDGSANKFSEKATADLHISALLIEVANIKEKVYMIEIAHGDDKTPVTPYRFISGETVKLPAVQDAKVRADHVPPGETIYYRMKCETGGKTCDLHIRYHLH